MGVAGAGRSTNGARVQPKITGRMKITKIPISNQHILWHDDLLFVLYLVRHSPYALLYAPCPMRHAILSTIRIPQSAIEYLAPRTPHLASRTPHLAPRNPHPDITDVPVISESLSGFAALWRHPRLWRLLYPTFAWRFRLSFSDPRAAA